MKNNQPYQFNRQQDSSENQNTELKKNTVPVITKDDLNKEMDHIMNESQLNKENLLKNQVINTIPENTMVNAIPGNILLNQMKESMPPISTTLKEPFTLSTITSLDQLTNLINKAELYPATNKYCETYLYPVPVYDESGEPSLYDLIFCPTVLDFYVQPFVSANETTPEIKKCNHSITALLLRRYRFVLRFITVECTISLVENRGLRQKFQDIFSNLKRKKIYFHFEKASFVGFKPTIESTIALIVKELTLAEKALKEIIPAVLILMRSNYLPHVPPQVAAVLGDIAPFGLVGVEKDYYYPIILFSYLPNSPLLGTLFNPEQLKQWLIY